MTARGKSGVDNGLGDVKAAIYSEEVRFSVFFYCAISGHPAGVL